MLCHSTLVSVVSENESGSACVNYHAQLASSKLVDCDWIVTYCTFCGTKSTLCHNPGHNGIHYAKDFISMLFRFKGQQNISQCSPSVYDVQLTIELASACLIYFSNNNNNKAHLACLLSYLPVFLYCPPHSYFWLTALHSNN